MAIKMIQITSPAEWNQLIDQVLQYTSFIEGKYKFGGISLTDISYFHAGPKNVEVTTKYGLRFNKATTYLFTLDGTEHPLMTGGEALATLKRACSKDPFDVFPNLSEDPVANTFIGRMDYKFINQQSGLLYSNPKFKDKKVYGYAYDLNSAYLAQIAKKIPRTDYYKDFNRVVGPNEVGFIYGDKLTLIEPGRFAEVIFDVVDSPKGLKRFAELWSGRKKDKKDPYHDKAKLVINSAIGCLQYSNPWIRAYIVEKCNNHILALKDDNTIHCNTDCIISTKPLDLPISEELGDWSYDEGWITLHNEFDYESDWKNVHRGVNTNNILYEIKEFKIYDISSEIL